MEYVYPLVAPRVGVAVALRPRLVLLVLLMAVLFYPLVASAPAACSRLRGGVGEGVWCSVACYYLTEVRGDLLLSRAWSVAVVEPEEVNTTLIHLLEEQGTLVLAYINAGFAEEWRSYWKYIKDKPWVHEEGPYGGEHFVEYWRKEWRDLLVRLALRYMGMGFHGVYLDNIDVYQLIEEMNPPWARGVDLRGEMVKLVCSVAREVRRLYPQARVFVNIGGAVELVYSPMLGCIDGMLREELWHRVEDGKVVPQDPDETSEALEALAYAAKAGKTVIVVDPVEDGKAAWRFCLEAWMHGFVPVPQPATAMDYSVPPPRWWCECRFNTYPVLGGWER